jgi:DNA-3-methyladenine glycosylase I
MADPVSYCEAILAMESDNPHVRYHDEQYGFPIHDDHELFGRLILEINQAGLSWTTILNKQENFRRAYAEFEVDRIARFGEADRTRLLADAGIIRNRLKVDAAIHNAKVVLDLRREFGSFERWLDTHYRLNREEWVKLFKRTFRFTGGEITNEFLMSTGYLPGAHVPGCPIYAKIAALGPPWMRAAGRYDLIHGCPSGHLPTVTPAPRG